MKTYRGAKYLWQVPSHDDATVADIAQRYSLSFPIAQTLYARGFTSHEAVDEFLFSSYSKDVHDPTILKDCQKAVDRLLFAIKQQEPILVFGDYDVDGITSSALVMRCLLPLGAKVNFFLPHRVKDGYGLSTKVVERAAQNGYKVILTVDNGITAFEPAQRAKELGIDLIITDHHRSHGATPDAFAIVNPNQHDCPYPFKYLAGVGVIFKVLSHLYAISNLELPQKAYELLLLGTVADVVPLKGENRFWVRHGLQQINSVESIAFSILKQNGKVTKELLSSTDIGFSIAPQINALGRLEDPRQGVQFLIGSEQDRIAQTGKVLFELNEARKLIERSIFQEIVNQIESKAIDLDHENIICAASGEWPPGVIGLVASRLVSKYGRPTILFHVTKQGIAKGSCRSIDAFNMFDALQSCQDLLTNFGGHSQAAGLALPLANVAQLKERLEARVKELVAPQDLVQKISLDAVMPLGEASQKLVGDMKLLEPFGHQNRQPQFLIQNVVCLGQPTMLKDAHLKCQIFSEGATKPLIFFNRPELYEWFVAQKDTPFNVAAEVSENYWNEKTTIQLIGLDVGVE